MGAAMTAGAHTAPAVGSESMIIEHTAEELNHIQAIKRRYSYRAAAIRKEIDAAERAEDQDAINSRTLELRALDGERTLELTAYNAECEAARFKAIKGGTDGIIENAKEQTQIILSMLHNDLRVFYKLEDAAIINQTMIATMQDGTLYLKADYALKHVKAELQRHISALEGNGEDLNRLLSAIIAEIEKSPFTAGSAQTAGETAAPADREALVKRPPLEDVKLHGLMNDKTSTQLLQDIGVFSEEANGQLRFVEHTPAKTIKKAADQGRQLTRNETIFTFLSLVYEGTEVNMSKKLTAYDKSVYEALATRFYYQRKKEPDQPLYITPREIWRTMNGRRGNDKTAKPGKTQLDKICRSIDKMRFTNFTMDISEEIRAFKLSINDERIRKGVINSYLLNSSKVEFETDKGNSVIGYKINEEPILYTYNRAKDHVIFVPYDLLDTSGTINDSENVTEFKNYLLQTIQLIKEGAADQTGKRFKRSNRILISDIYIKTGIDTPEQRAQKSSFTSDAARKTYIRKTKNADCKKIEGILESWKNKGWIRSYTALNEKRQPVKARQSVIAYDIET